MTANQDAMRYCTLSHMEGCQNSDHEKMLLHYDVDIGMIPILKVLHNKGYETRFCCSGHANRTPIMLSTSLAFNKDYDIALPNGFYLKAER